jgi:ElaB/YqjD/DUF883 family membrane-anchored ribosome-binding protein
MRSFKKQIKNNKRSIKKGGNSFTKWVRETSKKATAKAKKNPKQAIGLAASSIGLAIVANNMHERYEKYVANNMYEQYKKDVDKYVDELAKLFESCEVIQKCLGPGNRKEIVDIIRNNKMTTGLLDEYINIFHKNGNRISKKNEDIVKIGKLLGSIRNTLKRAEEVAKKN